MSVGMRVRWMQLAAQFFHEDPNRAADVRNRSVYEANHEGYIIAATPLECVPGQLYARSDFTPIRRSCTVLAVYAGLPSATFFSSR